MLRLSRVPLFAAGSLLLSACVMTERPLSDEESSKVDERLTNAVWEEVLPPGETREAARLEFTRHDDQPNAMRLVRRVTNEEPRYYTVYALERPAILSIGLENDEGKVTWLPMKYDIDEHGDLKLAGLDRQLFCPAVADGKLRGDLRKNDDGECVAATLSSDPEDVLKFIADHADEAWAPPSIYRKR
ncbi:MAG: hypothetical protein WD066_03380 [Planctomycetaceae bacterium]